MSGLAAARARSLQRATSKRRASNVPEATDPIMLERSGLHIASHLLELRINFAHVRMAKVDIMLPIIDAHHHIYRQADIPWLLGPMVPRIFGPYEAIRRDYPIAEYLDDLKTSNVVGSVYVQVNWAKNRAVEEATWVQSVAHTVGWPHAIVGYADLLEEDSMFTLNALTKIPLVRGIRMQLHWHENPQYRFASAPDVMNSARFRKNFAHIADCNFVFELQVFASQMKDAANLAAEFPGVTFILQHAGMPEDMSTKGKLAWRDGMQWLADQPNIVSKLSALGTFIHRNDATHIAQVVHETIAIFGAERCFFGSNFPIEKLWTSYSELVSAYRDAISKYDAAEQLAMLHDNAVRVYKLDAS
jgi:predicted TIM-barrel fold metal-dependent hydrolase